MKTAGSKAQPCFVALTARSKTRLIRFRILAAISSAPTGLSALCWPFPGLRFACPGLFSFGPPGAMANATSTGVFIHLSGPKAHESTTEAVPVTKPACIEFFRSLFSRALSRDRLVQRFLCGCCCCLLRWLSRVRAKPEKRALDESHKGGFFLRKKTLEGIAPGYSYSGFAVGGTSGNGSDSGRRIRKRAPLGVLETALSEPPCS